MDLAPRRLGSDVQSHLDLPVKPLRYVPMPAGHSYLTNDAIPATAAVGSGAAGSTSTCMARMGLPGGDVSTIVD